MFKVSIIIPTYKPDSYLYECLTSLIKQTIDKSVFEIILVLNGPKFPYYSEILDFIEETNGFAVKIIHNKNNGVSLARNLGLQIASGRYIGFIDDDDIVSLNYIESLIYLCEPGCIVCSNVKTFKENINDCENDYISRAYNKIKHKEINNVIYFRRFISSACFKLIPREILKDRFFNSSFNIGEDALFMASISDKIKKLKLAPEDTIYYRRIRDDSSSRKKRNLSFEIINSFGLMREYIKIYIRSPFKYNLLFFITRELAVLKSLIHRIK